MQCGDRLTLDIDINAELTLYGEKADSQCLYWLNLERP